MAKAKIKTLLGTGLAALCSHIKPAKVCQEVKAENLNKNNCCRVQ